MAIKKGRATDAVARLFSVTAAEQAHEAYEAHEVKREHPVPETHEAQEAYEAHEDRAPKADGAYRAADTQGKRGKKALRMTMAFSEENMDYIRTMGKLESDGLRQPADRGGPPEARGRLPADEDPAPGCVKESAMDLKKTNYFDPRKMAARKRWTVQETGQGLIAMTGYAYLGDEEKTALFSGADLDARIRQASAEKPREMELYLRLSNWLVIRRRETLQLKSHAMQVLQLIWRGLFVDMAQQVIAASELKDERLSARRQAVAETLSLSDEQLKEGVDILRQNFSTIAAFNVLMTLLSDTYQIDTFGYVIDADDELVMYEEALTLDELSGHRAGLFDLAEIAVTRDKLDAARAILEGGYTFPMADTRLLDSLLR